MYRRALPKQDKTITRHVKGRGGYYVQGVGTGGIIAVVGHPLLEENLSSEQDRHIRINIFASPRFFCLF